MGAPKAPLLERIYCAFKAGSSSDLAALTVWGQDSSGLWLLDVVNRRMSFTDTLAAIAASW